MLSMIVALFFVKISFARDDCYLETELILFITAAKV